jgi:hypothetical protein
MTHKLCVSTPQDTASSRTVGNGMLRCAWKGNIMGVMHIVYKLTYKNANEL